ncbi:MAG: class I mannose-6-phosphate isomerase [Clostridia bacterium]|nr:class I mannose-6-phosphate isomerase [Clostridia bacterium]
MYPLKFKPIYFEKIWGGRGLEWLKDDLPDGNIGESWELACHDNGINVISNGAMAGKKLSDAVDEYGLTLLGHAIDPSVFPLLIKLIYAREPLSVQVHPNDDYARIHAGELGKTEAWYIIKAEPGAKLIVGTKAGLTQAQFAREIEKGTLETSLNELEVFDGDVVFVKSGLVHAIGGGILLAEVQQNSDTTYRVYDYNRGREIHVDRALDVVDFDLAGKKSGGLTVKKAGYDKTYHCLCKEFSLEIYHIHDFLEESSDAARFFVFTCVDGGGSIFYDGGRETLQVGETVLIPANLGIYRIEGNMKLIKSYVPDVAQVERAVLEEIEA